MDGWDSLLNITMLLALAAFLGAVFEKLRQSAIVGYLMAGMLVGPGGLNLVENVEVVHILAELGVALLLFTIGLEFSLTHLKEMGRFAAGGGTLQILVSMVVFTIIALGFGAGMREALLVGIMIAPSSTACVLRLLRSRAEIDSIHGRNATGILLLQDLALVPLVLFVSLLGEPVEISRLFTRLVGMGGGFFLFMLLFLALSRLLLPRVLRASAVLKNRELLLLVATVTALGAAWLAHALGLSPALGAFIAGLLIAGSPYAAEIRADVSSLRTLFVTLFFVSVGALADLGWIFSHAALVAEVVLAVLLLKAGIIVVIARIFQYSWREAVATGVVLAQVGEFSFVLGETALRAGAIGDERFQLMASAILFTMLLTPWLVSQAPGWGENLDRRLGSRGLRSGAPDPGDLEVGEEGFGIVVGFGPAGRAMLRAMQRHGLQVRVVEMNPENVPVIRSEGGIPFLGDATKEVVLEHAGVQTANLVAVTLPDHRVAANVVREVLSLVSEMPILARARHSQHASELHDAGALVVVDEERSIGEALVAEFEHLREREGDVVSEKA